MMFNVPVFRKRALVVVDPETRNEYRDWDNATLLPLRANVQPLTSGEDRENVDRQDVAQERYNMRVHIDDIDVKFTDRIVYQNVDYDVIGFDGQWRDVYGKGHRLFVIERHSEDE